MKVLRHILLMLLLSLLIGFMIGTIIRMRLAGPEYYMSRIDVPAPLPSIEQPVEERSSGQKAGAWRRRGFINRLLGAAAPLDIGHAGARVLEPREHEEQVG